MYIINHKHKDYYDGVAGTTGIDKTIVYDRKLIDVDEKDIPAFFAKRRYFTKEKESSFHDLYSYNLTKKGRETYPAYSHFVVGFCGKLYVGWKLYNRGKEIHCYSNEVITTITYDFDYIKTIVELKHWGGLLLEDTVNYIRSSNAIQLFRDCNSPVFIYDGDFNRTSIDKKVWGYKQNSKFFINPILKDYEFYKIFDTFQAFQEISMFMGGVLGNKEKDIVEVADKYKIGQHGFDKWSFRKMPENK